MNRRNLAVLLSVTLLAACLVCAGCFTLYLGLSLDLGPFSSESLARVLIPLQGGTRFLLTAGVPDGATIPNQEMETERTILQDRLGALGVKAIVKIEDQRHLVVDVAGEVTPSQFSAQFGTGLLEFIDAGSMPLESEQIIQTTGLSIVTVPGQPSPTLAPLTPRLYRTVMTGRDLRSASVAFQQTTKQPYIAFALTDNGTRIFADFTSKNVGKYLAIVVDKKVLSCPVVKSAITEGSGIIEGRFTLDEAVQLATQLRFGALPFPLNIVEVTPIPR